MSNKISKTDVEVWLNDPVTNWFRSFLGAKFDTEISVMEASESVKLWEVKGQNNVVYYIVDPMRVYNELEVSKEDPETTEFIEFNEE